MQIALVLTAAWLVAPGASAQPSKQASPASLVVQVTDPSGGGIPHAVIVVRNDARAVDATADASGAVTLSLAAGAYEIVASADGFESRSQNSA
jgi:hypothetical protein